jgi:hypothetical protein
VNIKIILNILGLLHMKSRPSFIPSLTHSSQPRTRRGEKHFIVYSFSFIINLPYLCLWGLYFAIQMSGGNDSENDSGDDGGLFGSIGFMFDTAREKLSKDFSITIDAPEHNQEQEQEQQELMNGTGKGTRTDTMEVNISLFIIDDDPGHVQSGQYLWPAAYALSRYLLIHWQDILPSITSSEERPQRSDPPVVIELGSGVGMCGLFLGTYFHDVQAAAKRKNESSSSSSSSSLPTKIILTDYDPGCLEMLSDNIELNSLQDCCQVARVEWGKELTNVFEIIQQNSESMPRPCLIIGSDLLYCVSVVRPLFTTIRTLLSGGGSLNLNTVETLDNQPTNMLMSDGGMFILASSFDIGEDVQSEMDACCREFGISQAEVQSLDLSGAEKQYRIQYFTKKRN